MQKISPIIWILLAGLSFGVLVYCTTQAQGTVAEEPLPTVTTALAEVVDYQPAVFATGTLAAASEAKLSFKTGGIIARLYVEEGQRVRRGQLLAELRLEEIAAQNEQATLGAEQARISLENARLALQLAERDYRNAQGLYADSVATREQVENAEVQFNNARNQLTAAEKGLAFREQGMTVAAFNLQYSKIVAPADGIILERYAEVNELVGPGNPVFVFGSREAAQVLRIAVADRDRVLLTLGDSAQVRFDAYPGREFPAVVRELAATADPRSGTYEVELELPNTASPLLDGLIGSATIYASGREKLVAVPVDALLAADQEKAVLMVVEAGRAVRDTVAIHHLAQDRLMLQRDALAPGTTVIVSGASYLEDGDSVRIQEPSSVTGQAPISPTK